MTEEEIFDGAIQHDDPVMRAAFLDEVCGADVDLRRCVESLLKAHYETGSFLAAPQAVHDVLTTPPIAEGPGAIVAPYYSRADGF